MQLSEHDLKQLDEEKIRALQAEQLRALSVKLLADLKEARDRLNQAPDNSSRPPSSRAPWDGVSPATQEDRESDEGTAEEADPDGEEEAETKDPSAEREDKKGSQQRAGRQKGLAAGQVQAHEAAPRQAGKPGQDRVEP